MSGFTVLVVVRVEATVLVSRQPSGQCSMLFLGGFEQDVVVVLMLDELLVVEVEEVDVASDVLEFVEDEVDVVVEDEVVVGGGGGGDKLPQEPTAVI